MIHLSEVHGQGEEKACKYCKAKFPSRQKARMHERRAHEGYKHKKRNRIRTTASGMQYYVVNRKGSDVRQIAMHSVLPSSDAQKNQIVTLTNERVRIITTKTEPSEDEVMVENDGEVSDKDNDVLEKEFELVEVPSDSHRFVIQECDTDGNVIQAEGQSEDKNIEHQVLEIPEDTEQCQLILYPDGTFKLLNILDAAKV